MMNLSEEWLESQVHWQKSDIWLLQSLTYNKSLPSRKTCFQINKPNWLYSVNQKVCGLSKKIVQNKNCSRIIFQYNFFWRQYTWPGDASALISQCEGHVLVPAKGLGSCDHLIVISKNSGMCEFRIGKRYNKSKNAETGVREIIKGTTCSCGYLWLVYLNQ